MKDKTHDAIENAAKNLPEGFRIELVIEKNSGSVSLLDPDGNDHDFPSNRETISDEITDAVDHAVEMAKNPGIDIGEYFPGGMY